MWIGIQNAQKWLNCRTKTAEAFLVATEKTLGKSACMKMLRDNALTGVSGGKFLLLLNSGSFMGVTANADMNNLDGLLHAVAQSPDGAGVDGMGQTFAIVFVNTGRQ